VKIICKKELEMKSASKAEHESAKSLLRNGILAQRKQLGVNEVRVWSKRITELIIESPFFQQAQVIMGYAPCNNEVDISPLIQVALEQGKRVLLPNTKWENRQLLPVAVNKYPEDLVAGPYGILEPSLEKGSLWPIQKIELVIVPGVAFDLSGYRLGYGQGFYDRFLIQLVNGTAIVGAAFSFQIVNTVYPEVHDFPMPVIVSENGWISKSISRRI
jgi:5-formyltetrahydrofolate cyclo-ligase